MVNEVKYTNIRRVLDNLTDHPMLRNLTLDQVVRYTIRFISLHGYPKLYHEDIKNIEIEDYRGVLPCDCIAIKQVKDLKTGFCLRTMTDSFPEGMQHKHGCMPMGEYAFKTQGRVIYTSFKEGIISVAYKSIITDDEGFPLLMDNETYLNALEAYIKMKVFGIKFDEGKIPDKVYQNAKQEYGIASANLQTEMTTPSVSEAQAISNYMTSLLPRVTEFERGFRGMGSRELLRIQ